MDNYTSYTMYIEIQTNESTSFYNLTIEDKNGTEQMFITKYTPTDYWLDNKDEAYQGNVSTQRINNLDTYNEDMDVVTEDSIDANGSGASSTYPEDCNGTVLVTNETVPYQCGCADHWPDDDRCTCLSNPAGYNYVIFYECLESNIGDQETNDSPDGNGGDTNVYDPINDSINSITIMVDKDGNLLVLEDQIVNELINPCQVLIVDAVLNANSSIAEDIQASFNSINNNDGTEYNLLIGQSSSLGERAITSALPGCYSGQCTFSLTFDNFYLSNATDLSLAATTIHESIHALLSYRFQTGELQIQSVDDPDIADLVIAYTYVQASQDPDNDGTQQTLNNLQHQYMVSLINDMGDGLYAWAIATNTNDGNTSYNPSDFSQFDSDPTDNIDGLKEYCRSMFWTPTLRETTNFSNLPFDYRQLVEAIDEAEASGQTFNYNDINNNWYVLQPNGNQAPNGEPCNY